MRRPDDVRTSWRSWCWNIVTAGLMFVMVLVGLAGLANADGVGIGLSGLIVVVFGTLTVRSLRMGVFVKPRGIVMRGFAHTTTVPWDQVVEVVGDEPAPGLAVISPMVVRKLPGGKVKEVDLNVLGGYGFSPVRPTPAEQAVEALNVHLAEYRRRSGTSSPPR